MSSSFYPEAEQQRRARFEGLNAETKERLLDVAENEFIARDFNTASLNQILSEAGMSKGQAYYYIKDKSDLYFRVCERAFARLTEAIGGWAIDTTSVEAFWTSVDNLFDAVTTVCLANTRIAALGRTIYLSTAAYEALAEPLAQLHAVVVDIVGKAQKIGAIRTDLPTDLISTLLFSMLSALDRWFALNLTTLPPVEIIKLNHICRQTFRDLAAPKALT